MSVALVPPLANRRRTPRIPVVPNQVSLEWWESDRRQRCAARLLNLSAGGALLAAAEPPREDAVWLRLEEPARSDWVKATVVHRAANGALGVLFPMSCPYDLQMAAELGIDLLTMMSAFRSSECEDDLH